ncbi:SusD/RagB family nutrient-binding outer membrane lipoprotein [Sphingobacterium chuzhouense]|uniref:SusD/RagB family nutrient-binding outer membrane lipoprotein n=1 Tax=Sphingobacterium chuzhouense TaxID=1742264 RepID=A0ABR7XN48_9SPHI|nr:SusD/RagB family nutrient-binding outer membrane lipoprotein [Sphingobacterium chuzhouense]MBD1420600.1 SusD/RagB family nutrient-binding outer membrane lipoprotein [Sphingobacterium chuzhouense]
MKTRLKSIILMTTLALGGLSSCQDFVEINTNPNESATAAPQSLLGPAVYKVITANINRNLRINNEFTQVTVTTNDNLEFHRYLVRPSESEYMWRSWYVELTNIKDIYKSAGEQQQAGYQIYQGISLVLEAWVYSLLTDMFGDIPYYESNKGYTDGNTSPAFERQQEIYKNLFLKLEQANQLLNTTNDIAGDKAALDPIFNTDPEKWRKFGNSLYLRLLLRVAHKPELNAITKIKEIVDIKPSEYPIMESNDDSAVLRFTNQQPYFNPYFNAREIDFNGNKGYSDFFINNLVAMGDPRLKIWATEATLGVYSGMQSGYQEGSVPERGSTLHKNLMTDPRLGNIMNYAELQFILAECALRNYVNQDAEAAYNVGINASMAFWDQTIGDEYFDNPLVSFSSTDSNNDKLGKVHLQKYFAMLFTDFQQWYEYRRTGLLDFSDYIGGGVQNDGKMPVRLNYPLITQSLNTANYKAAVERLGGDNLNGLMWWQPNLF